VAEPAPGPEAVSSERWEIPEKGTCMLRYASDKMRQEVKCRYFELIRQGALFLKAREVGVSLGCGSKWFIEAGSVTVNEEVPISSRHFSQDDRIEIADGLTAGEPEKSIALRIGKSFQRVSREIGRNRNPTEPTGRDLPTIRRI
jgi:IS30 family transposase